MKPEVWIPYVGQDFERDTKGWSPADKWSYWGGAIWSYWCGECQGLPNDDQELRRICECESVDWNRVRGKIFGAPGKFQLENGRWHQKRAHEEYELAKFRTESAQKFGRMGAEKRWGKNGEANSQGNALPNSVNDRQGNRHSHSSSPPPQPPSVPQSQSQVKVGALKPRPTVTDEVWLSDLRSLPAYAGIDVNREFGKMGAWCEANHKTPSRKRFVNWLNRCDKPMTNSKPNQGHKEIQENLHAPRL